MKKFNVLMCILLMCCFSFVAFSSNDANCDQQKADYKAKKCTGLKGEDKKTCRSERKALRKAYSSCKKELRKAKRKSKKGGSDKYVKQLGKLVNKTKLTILQDEIKGLLSSDKAEASVNRDTVRLYKKKVRCFKKVERALKKAKKDINKENINMSEYFNDGSGKCNSTALKGLKGSGGSKSSARLLKKLKRLPNKTKIPALATEINNLISSVEKDGAELSKDKYKLINKKVKCFKKLERQYKKAKKDISKENIDLAKYFDDSKGVCIKTNIKIDGLEARGKSARALKLSDRKKKQCMKLLDRMKKKSSGSKTVPVKFMKRLAKKGCIAIEEKR